MIYKSREKLEFKEILRQKYVPYVASSLSPSPRLWGLCRPRLTQVTYIREGSSGEGRCKTFQWQKHAECSIKQRGRKVLCRNLEDGPNSMAVRKWGRLPDAAASLPASQPMYFVRNGPLLGQLPPSLIAHQHKTRNFGNVHFSVAGVFPALGLEHIWRTRNEEPINSVRRCQLDICI